MLPVLPRVDPVLFSPPAPAFERGVPPDMLPELLLFCIVPSGIVPADEPEADPVDPPEELALPLMSVPGLLLGVVGGFLVGSLVPEDCAMDIPSAVARIAAALAAVRVVVNLLIAIAPC